MSTTLHKSGYVYTFYFIDISGSKKNIY